MAKKIPRSAAEPAASGKPEAAGEDQLAILHPERTITIAGREVTMREYGFVEGLQLRAEMKPFLDALYDLIGRDSKPPTFEQVEDLLSGPQSRNVLEMIARAADVEMEWIESLSDEAGYFLMQLWWSVNSGFFIRRVIGRLATQRAVAKMSRAGRASITRSSEPDTAAPQPTSAA